MKTASVLAVLFGGLMFLTQCSSMTEAVDREDGEDWNEGVVWKPQTQGGTDFVPMDFAGAPQEGPAHGRWVVDQQDGYRFYVPEAGTKRFSRPILEAEAQKATNRLSKGQQRASNAAKAVAAPVLTTAVLLTPPLWLFAFHEDNYMGPENSLPGRHHRRYLASEQRYHNHGGGGRSHGGGRGHGHGHGGKGGGGKGGGSGSKAGSSDSHHGK